MHGALWVKTLYLNSKHMLEINCLFCYLLVVFDTSSCGKGRPAIGDWVWTQLTSPSCQFHSQRLFGYHRDISSFNQILFYITSTFGEVISPKKQPWRGSRGRRHNYQCPGLFWIGNEQFWRCLRLSYFCFVIINWGKRSIISKPLVKKEARYFLEGLLNWTVTWSLII